MENRPEEENEILKNANDKKQRKRRTIEQIKVYIITYQAYVVLHCLREFWSMSKMQIVSSDPA
jgi:hypothetical protein